MRALANLVGIVLAAAIILAGPWLYFYDRDPKARPPINIGFLWVHVRWPISPAAEAASLLQSYNTCHQSNITFEAAISRQNASLTALSAAGSRATAQVETVVHASQGPMAAATSAQASISAPVTGDDVCARAKVVDQRFVESLR